MASTSRARRAGKRRQHARDLVARAGVEHRKGLAAPGGQRQQRAARVLRREPGPDQAAPAQRLQQAAEVAHVEVELRRQLAGARAAAPAELVDQPRLGQRVGGAEQPAAQRADARCVESIEPPHRVDLHRRMLGKILAFVKLSPEEPWRHSS
jgi:hypothetical protein